jgi:hypothetical protein
VNCPFCHGCSQLSINYEYGQRDANGWPMTYLCKCFAQNCLADRGNRSDLAGMIMGSGNGGRGEVFLIEGTPREPEPVQLVPPGRCVRLSEQPAEHPAVHFLTVQRGYRRELFDYYGLEYCLEADPRWPMVSGRIIVPIWFRGRYVGWQARYVGEPRLDVAMEFTLPGMRTAQIVYNFDRAILQPYVVVVNNVMDVWTIGDSAVATLGDRVHSLQHGLLAENWRDKPVVLLCHSAREAYLNEQTESLRRAGHFGRVGAIQLPPGCNAATYGTEAIHEIINREVEASIAQSMTATRPARRYLP